LSLFSSNFKKQKNNLFLVFLLICLFLLFWSLSQCRTSWSSLLLDIAQYNLQSIIYHFNKQSKTTMFCFYFCY